MLQENFTRLGVLGNASATEVFTKVDAYMTDSASKNLNVGNEVAKNLESTHVPLHLLCGAHPAEVSFISSFFFLCL